MSRIVKIALEFAVDKKGLEDATKGAKNAAEAIALIDKRTEEALGSIEKYKRSAEYFSEAGATFAGFGASLTAPLLLASNSYVKAMGQTEQASSRWLAAQNDIARSQVRIGRVATEQLLPIMEKLANFAEDAADFAEKHPDIIKGAAYIGSAAVVVGGLSMAIGQAINFAASMQSLITLWDGFLAKSAIKAGIGGFGEAAAGAAGAGAAGAGAAGAAGTGAAGAAAGGLVLSTTQLVAAGTVIGIAIVDVLSRTDFNKYGWVQSINKTLQGATGGTLGFQAQSAGKYATAAAYGLGKLFDDDTAQKWAAKVGTSIGAIEPPANKAALAINETAKSLGGLANSPAKAQILDAFDAFQQANTDAEQKTGEARNQIIENYGKQRVAAEENYERTRTEMVKEFKDRQSEELAGHNKNIDAKNIAFNDDQKSREIDHNKTIADIRKSARASDISAEKNYRKSVSDVMKNLQTQNTQAEQDYLKRRKTAVAKQGDDIAKMEADYQKEALRRLEDHNKTLRGAIRNQDVAAFLDEQERYSTERKRAEEDHNSQVAEKNKQAADELNQMEEEYKQAEAQRKQQAQDRLNELKNDYEAEKQARATETEERINQINTEFEAEQQKRIEDHQKEMEADDQQFQLKQAKDQEHFDQQLEKMKTQHEREATLAEENKNEAIKQLEASAKKEAEIREKAFKNQLNQLDASLLGEQQKRIAHYAKLESDLTAYIKRQQSAVNAALNSAPKTGGGSGGTSSGSGASGSWGSGASGGANVPFLPGKGTSIFKRASGGYTGHGLYEMGEQGREFVLNAQTTTNLEKMLGGGLTQSSIMSLAGGTTSTNNNISMNPIFVFNDRDDSQLIAAQVKQTINDTLQAYTRGSR